MAPHTRKEHLRKRVPAARATRSGTACSGGNHEWVLLSINRNFRGDVVSALYVCRRCGTTKRERIN